MVAAGRVPVKGTPPACRCAETPDSPPSRRVSGAYQEGHRTMQARKTGKRSSEARNSSFLGKRESRRAARSRSSSAHQRTGIVMNEPGKEHAANTEEHQGNSFTAIPNGTVFAYNLDERETPGGLKVRWKIRVVTGPDAARTEARQAEAIRELLQWARHHQHHTQE
jgi:hypothetical protein